MKKNLLLLLVTTLILTFLSEVFIRFFFPQDLQRYWVNHEPNYGLPVNKKNYIHKLHRFKSYKATYKFGEFHNRVTVNNKRILNKPKILVLGESFTFGWLSKDEDSFINKFQKDNLNYNFINVAVGAWGSAHYTLFTEIYCEKIKPTKIFVFMNTDDFFRGYKSGYYKEINGKIIRNKKPFTDNQKDSYLDKNIPLYKLLKSNSHLFMLIRNIVYNFLNEPFLNEWSSERYWPRQIGDHNQETSKKVNSFNEKIYSRLHNVSKKCGADLYIFNLMWAKPKFMKDTNPNKLFLKNSKNFFNKNEINYFESDKFMKELYKNPMNYIIDIDFHPNKKGAHLIYLNLRDEINRILIN